MSNIKIGKGIGVPPYLLKDAEFVREPVNSKIYCRIKAKDGVTYAMTSYEALRLSGRGGKGPARFRAWLAKQDDPITKERED